MRTENIFDSHQCCYAPDWPLVLSLISIFVQHSSKPIIRILLDGNKAHYTYPYESDPLLQHKPRRKLPAGIKTAQFQPRTATIDESSVSGNIAVFEDVYINQLQMSYTKSSDMAIPSINDQSTDARIRGAKALRMKDINPFTQLQCIQLGFGLFTFA